MGIFKSVCIAFSMYSKIPVPQFAWKEEDMRFAICFFPLVGAVIGALTFGAYVLAVRCGFNLLGGTLLLVLIPLALTGGIHVDGYMDTSDALSSWRPMEKRLEILKDSHIGAFSVIMLAILGGVFLMAVSFLMQAGISAAAEGGKALGDAMRAGGVWAAGFFYARALSGLSVVTFKNARKAGTLYTFAKAADGAAAKRVMIGEVICGAAGMILIRPLAGAVSAAAGLSVFLYYRYRAYKDFGGITGDLAGWFLCICEAAIALTAGLFAVLAAG